MLSAAPLIAITSASDFWPASSTNRTSTVSLHVGARPQPRGAADDVDRVVDERGEHRAVVVDAHDLLRRAPLALVGLLHRPQRHARVRAASRTTASSRLPITECECAVIPTCLPCSTRSTISVGAERRLARAGRPLDRQVRVVEQRHDPAGRVAARFAVGGERRARRDAGDARRPAQQQVACGA